MADKLIKDDTQVDVSAKTAKAPREGKQVGAWFTPEEYADIREVRFVKRHDKDSDVIRAAVKEYTEKHLTASL